MTSLPEKLTIKPFKRPVRGEVLLPGSKSLTNRALALAALCPHPVTLTGALFSEDSEIMVEALRRLGLTVQGNGGTCSLSVTGQENAFPGDRTEIHVGLAGTAARFLPAVCAAAKRGVYVIDGTPRMRERPMKGVIDALRALGADIVCRGTEGHLPIEIHARGLSGGPVRIDAQESSQFLSALLMAAPLASGPVEVTLEGGVRMPFVQMTARLMTHFGQPPVAQLAEDRFLVDAPRAYRLPGGTYAIEPDATAASYLLALPVSTGGRITVTGTQLQGASLQGDTQFIEVISEVGAIVRQTEQGVVANWSRGDLRRGVDRDFNEFSDTFLTLAAISPLLSGPTRITGVAHTRKQETDRIAGAVRELRKLGQDVEEFDDGLEIRPKPLKPDVEIETYGDHRFAMSFGVLGCHDLHGNGRPWLTVRNPGCCAKTFPEFFDLLARLHAGSH